MINKDFCVTLLLAGKPFSYRYVLAQTVQDAEHRAYRLLASASHLPEMVDVSFIVTPAQEVN